MALFLLIRSTIARARRELGRRKRGRKEGTSRIEEREGSSRRITIYSTSQQQQQETRCVCECGRFLSRPCARPDQQTDTIARVQSYGTAVRSCI